MKCSDIHQCDSIELMDDSWGSEENFSDKANRGLNYARIFRSEIPQYNSLELMHVSWSSEENFSDKTNEILSYIREVQLVESHQLKKNKRKYSDIQQNDSLEFMHGSWSSEENYSDKTNNRLNYGRIFRSEIPQHDSLELMHGSWSSEENFSDKTNESLNYRSHSVKLESMEDCLDGYYADLEDN